MLLDFIWISQVLRYLNSVFKKFSFVPKKKLKNFIESSLDTTCLLLLFIHTCTENIYHPLLTAKDVGDVTSINKYQIPKFSSLHSTLYSTSLLCLYWNCIKLIKILRYHKHGVYITQDCYKHLHTSTNCRKLIKKIQSTM